MKIQYFIKIEDPVQFEDAINHLAKGKWFEETDMRKADDETFITETKTAYDNALYYLAYKGINFINFETPRGIAFKQEDEFNLHFN